MVTRLMPPVHQTAGAKGYIHVVEYECGKLTKDAASHTAGVYRTNIYIHNSAKDKQTVYLKLLVPEDYKTGNWIRDTSGAIVFHLEYDSGLMVDSADILDAAVPDGADLGTRFITGYVVICNPTDLGAAPLDVTVTYTASITNKVPVSASPLIEKAKSVSVVIGPSKHVNIIPARKVECVPTPPL